MPHSEEVDSKEKTKKKASSGNSVHGKSIYKSASPDVSKEKSVYKSISQDVTKEVRTKRSNETKEAMRDGTTEEEGVIRKKNSGEKEKNCGEKGGIVRRKNSKEDVRKKEGGVVVVRKRASRDNVRSKTSKEPVVVRRRASNASTMSKYQYPSVVFPPPTTKTTLPNNKPKLEEPNHDAIREKSNQPASSDSGEFLPTSIPKTYFHSVDISFDLEDPIRTEDVGFTYSMVVRYVNRNCPLFNYLVVGDQIVEVNDNFVFNHESFVNWVNGESSPSKSKLKLIRPWNVHHCGDRLPTKTRKDSYYSVVDVYKGTGEHNGLLLKPKNKKCEVVKTDPKSRGGHAFFKNDRILDVDSRNVGLMKMEDVRKHFNRMLDTRGKCSFLVERDVTMRSSPNPSLSHVRGVTTSMEPSMGDDANEIGAREATRFQQMKSNPPKIKSILSVKEAPKNSFAGGEGAIAKTDKSSDSRRSNGGKKRVSMSGKNEVSRTPTDVKDPGRLVKVTAKNGITSFILSAFYK